MSEDHYDIAVNRIKHILKHDGTFSSFDLVIYTHLHMISSSLSTDPFKSRQCTTRGDEAIGQIHSQRVLLKKDFKELL